MGSTAGTHAVAEIVEEVANIPGRALLVLILVTEDGDLYVQDVRVVELRRLSATWTKLKHNGKG